MKITEEDLFYYVSAPKKLAEGKYDYIRENENLFTKELSFYKTLEKNIHKELPQGIMSKIKEKIPQIKNKNQ